jgi:transcriptional regulator with XRE-family HTH domain
MATATASKPARKPPGAHLRAAREARGLSLRETGRRAGIDPAHLLRVERGDKGLSVESLARLAGVLGLSDLARLLGQYSRET